MLELEWNALRRGERVFVHDGTRVLTHLVPGTVALVNMEKGSNGVGIQIVVPGAGSSVDWPNRLWVHRDPRDPSESCWRCEE